MTLQMSSTDRDNSSPHDAPVQRYTARRSACDADMHWKCARVRRREPDTGVNVGHWRHLVYRKVDLTTDGLSVGYTYSVLGACPPGEARAPARRRNETSES